MNLRHYLGGMTEVAAITERTSPPTRLLLLRHGDLKWANLDAELTEESAREIVAAFDKQGCDLVIDWEHAAKQIEDDPDAATHKAKPAPAAGWIKGLEYVAGEGIYADPIEWTDKAHAAIMAKEYKYTSPVILGDEKAGKVTPHRLHSVALVNRPRTQEQAELLAARLDKELIMANEKKTPQDEPKPVVESAADDPGNLMMKAVVVLQGAGVTIEDDATPEEIIQAFVEHMTGTAAPPDDAPAPEEEAASDTPVDGDTAEVAGLRAKASLADDYGKRLAAIEAKIAAEATEKLIDETVQAGKLLPANKNQMKAMREYAAKDPSGFKLFAASMPVLADPGVTAGVNGNDGATGSARTGCIRTASRTYEADPMVACGADVKHYVNAVLFEAGEKELTDAEVKALGK